MMAFKSHRKQGYNMLVMTWLVSNFQQSLGFGLGFGCVTG